MLFSRNRKDSDDPRDEVRCSCGLCFGIGGSIVVGVAMVVIVILYLACQLGVCKQKSSSENAFHTINKTQKSNFVKHYDSWCFDRARMNQEDVIIKYQR